MEHFGALPGRMVLIGLSLGGYFVTRAAGHESRFATVIASTPFPEPGKLFSASARAATNGGDAREPSTAALRSRQMLAWKAGVTTPDALLARWEGVRADPSKVTLPFLSIVGTG